MLTLRCMAITMCFLAACSGSPSASHGAEGGPATAWTPPLSRSELPTTDGSIAMGNLEAQIAGELRLAAYAPLTLTQRAGIAELIATRGQLLGRIADYERAAELAEELVRDAPTDGRAFVARAQSRSTFHRFGDALADLDRAESLGVQGQSIVGLRAAILQATGHYDEALVIRREAARALPSIRSLSAEASLRAELGQVDEATRLFSQAEREFRDVSPFPVVWADFQQGQMWMREGQLERARDFFAAAHERLPAYATAQGHLGEMEAALGRTDRAVELLRPLAETSDDPDYASQLARILAQAGRTDEARPWRDAAAARYDELVSRHPEAFADHAAEFWLSAGDPSKALSWAERNLTVRATGRAYELVLQAALAAQDRPAACEAAAHAATVRYAWPSLHTLIARGQEACEGPGARS